jgi:hypothetical protein
MRNLIVSNVVATLVLAGCGPSTTPPDAPKPTSIAQPTRSIHLRASFDDDPTTYIGRFLPDNVSEGDLDENLGAVTRCSAFIKPKVVNASQELDELMYASRSAGGSLGIPVVAKITGESDSQAALRVKYSIAKKMQAEVDAAGLDRCCKEQPDQCTKRYIGEFVSGSGEVFQAATRDASTEAEGATRQVTGDFEMKDSSSWRKVTGFKDMYFAFQATASMSGLAASTPSTDADCGYCDNLPSSLDGKYFCGLSPDAPSEAMSRDYAMRNAREQVVKYLGEYVTSKSETAATLMKGYTEDAQKVTAMSEGLASRVKDQKWCKAQTTSTPEGQKYRSRVLAFVANDQLKSAAKEAVESAIASEEKSGSKRLTKEQLAAIRAAVE